MGMLQHMRFIETSNASAFFYLCLEVKNVVQQLFFFFPAQFFFNSHSLCQTKAYDGFYDIVLLVLDI